jgi:hypothetical protein
MILGRPRCKLAGQLFHDLLRQAGAIGLERFRISKFKCRSAQINCRWLVVQLVVAAVGFSQFRQSNQEFTIPAAISQCATTGHIKRENRSISFRLRTRLTDEETLNPLLIM